MKLNSFYLVFSKPKANQYGITRFADFAGESGVGCPPPAGSGGYVAEHVSFWTNEKVQYTWNASKNRYVSGQYQSGLTGFPWLYPTGDLSGINLQVGIKETYQPPPGSPAIVKRYCFTQVLMGFDPVSEGCQRTPA
jgi:hypothetical protein